MPEHAPGRDDPFAPPDTPTLVQCVHCGREYESYLIHWVEADPDDSVDGFWCCPTPNCDGKGFLFDILPVDPDYRDERGELVFTGDEDEEKGLRDAELDDDDEMDFDIEGFEPEVIDPELREASDDEGPW